jgi:serine/threonine protein kinase/WD40 repeat protein
VGDDQQAGEQPDEHSPSIGSSGDGCGYHRENHSRGRATLIHLSGMAKIGKGSLYRPASRPARMTVHCQSRPPSRTTCTMTTETADWVGLTLDGRYTVTARLGEGGMGFVYRAQDARLDCDVVVKVPRAAMLEDAGFRQRFRDEVGALVKLAHPHVVKVSDFGQHEGVPFAVMQFLPGGSLEDRRPKDAAGHFRAISSKALHEWLLPVAEALDFIHKQGYVHRDVKPPNILFDAYKNAYISDFGVAKAVAGNKPAGAGITGTGMVLGTPTYMAPELVLGATFDGKIDQYALAVTVFELLAGKPPFDEPTPMATLVKRTIEEPPALAEARPGTGTNLSEAVAKALNKDPAQRYADCATFAKAVLAAASRTSNAPATHASSTPKQETPRAGVRATKAEGYGIIGSIPPAPGKRVKPNVVPVANIIEDGDGVFVIKAKARAAAVESSGKNGLMLALAGGGAVFAALIGVIIWLATANGGRKPSGSDATSANTIPQVPTPQNHSTDVPPPPEPQKINASGAPAVTELRPDPATIELLVGGPWMPIDVSVARTGTGPITIDLAPPAGVEVKAGSVIVQENEPARFELRALANAVVTRATVARLGVRGINIRRTIPVTLKRLDFRASLAAAGEVSLSPGQEKAVEIVVDRTGGYSGALIVTVPENAIVKAATMPVPADATTCTIPLTAQPTARPGGITIRILVAAADGGASHELAIVARIPPTAELRTFAGHTGLVHAASFSADGRLAISGGADGTVRLWDVATGTEKWKGEGHSGAVLSVAFSPDGMQAVSGGADKTVRVWDIATGNGRTFSVAANPDPGHGGPVWLVRFDDAKHAHSVSADKTIHWVVATGKPRQVPAGRPDLILGQKYKADISNGDEIKPATRIPNDSGEYLVSGVGTTITTLWKRGANDKAPLRSIGRAAGMTSSMKVAAISGDGARLLTVGENNGIYLWDMGAVGTTVRAARTTPGFPWTPDHDVTCVALDADGRQILLGGPGGLLKLWRAP